MAQVAIPKVYHVQNEALTDENKVELTFIPYDRQYGPSGFSPTSDQETSIEVASLPNSVILRVTDFLVEKNEAGRPVSRNFIGTQYIKLDNTVLAQTEDKHLELLFSDSIEDIPGVYSYMDIPKETEEGAKDDNEEENEAVEEEEVEEAETEEEDDIDEPEEEEEPEAEAEEETSSEEVEEDETSETEEEESEAEEEVEEPEEDDETEEEEDPFTREFFQSERKKEKRKEKAAQRVAQQFESSKEELVAANKKQVKPQNQNHQEQRPQQQNNNSQQQERRKAIFVNDNDMARDNKHENNKKNKKNKKHNQHPQQQKQSVKLVKAPGIFDDPLKAELFERLKEEE